VAFYERRLPHWQPVGKDIFLTWRLEGTLPSNRFVPPDGLDSGEAFAWIDRYLDKAQYGPSWLRRPELADIVVKALHHAQDNLNRFVLHAYLVMPNHVHMLITPRQTVPKIMHSLKGFTAREINCLLQRTYLPLWQRESYDHWLRDGEFDRIKQYIELNPVKAGLAREASEYPWSSAYSRQAG
jgi:REP element-mobilizing transposase RayT